MLTATSEITNILKKKKRRKCRGQLVGVARKSLFYKPSWPNWLFKLAMLVRHVLFYYTVYCSAGCCSVCNFSLFFTHADAYSFKLSEGSDEPNSLHLYLAKYFVLTWSRFWYLHFFIDNIHTAKNLSIKLIKIPFSRFFHCCANSCDSDCPFLRTNVCCGGEAVVSILCQSFC